MLRFQKAGSMFHANEKPRQHNSVETPLNGAVLMMMVDFFMVMLMSSRAATLRSMIIFKRRGVC